MALMVVEFRVLCLIALLPLGSLEFICPGSSYLTQRLSYGYIESNTSEQISQEYARMRIKLVFDSSMEGKPYKELVQKAADFWSNALSVKPVSGRIFKSQDCKSKEDIVYKASEESSVKEKFCLGSCANVTKCLDFEVPKEHLDGCKSCDEEGRNCSKNNEGRGTGVENADLVFYVFAIDTKKCQKSTVMASASFCEEEPKLDRPLFASTNICPKAAERRSTDVMLQVIKHEMLHSLGFGDFQLFRDSDGNPLWARDKNGEPIMDNGFQDERVFKTIERDWHVRGGVIKSNRTFLVTPNVAKEARAHFNCSDLEGAELEDYGGKGSRFGHFEARVFYDDAMKGNPGTGKSLFSRLDFAVLDDSGWYKVNYSQAEDMDFGRNLGCDFSMKSCKFWMDEKRKDGTRLDPFCDEPDIEFNRGYSCNRTKEVFSGCPLTCYTYEGIPKEYQNFDELSGLDSPDVGPCGSFDGYADFCPIRLRNYEHPGKPFLNCEKQNNDKESNQNESDSTKNVTEKHMNTTEEQPNVTEVEPNLTAKLPNVTAVDRNITQKEPNGTEIYPNGTETYKNGTERYTNETEKYTNATEKDPNETEKHTNGTEMYTNSTEKDPKFTEKDPNESDMEPKEDKKGTSEDGDHQMNDSSHLESTLHLVSFLTFILLRFF